MVKKKQEKELKEKKEKTIKKAEKTELSDKERGFGPLAAAPEEDKGKKGKEEKKKKPKKEEFPGYGHEGSKEEIWRWIEKHGSVPTDGPIIFDGNGNNVSLDNIQCKRTYFILSVKDKKAEQCPDSKAAQLACTHARLSARRGAQKVMVACKKIPGCNAAMFFHYREWYCVSKVIILPKGKQRVIGHAAECGYCYRVECIEV